MLSRKVDKFRSPWREERKLDEERRKYEKLRVEMEEIEVKRRDQLETKLEAGMLLG
jgi:hypothetical protein